jgi:hypothetical protein
MHARALVCVACVLCIQYEADLAKATMVSSADLKETERKEKEEALKQKARAKAEAQVAEACVLRSAHAPACCMFGVCYATEDGVRLLCNVCTLVGCAKMSMCEPTLWWLPHVIN